MSRGPANSASPPSNAVSASADAVCPPPGEARWQELARGAAQAAPVEGPYEMLRELLGLEVAGSHYAIPIERVREIVRLRPITPVPRVPASVLGVIALRGEIVQVVDLLVASDAAALTRRHRSPTPGRRPRSI